MFCGAVKVGKQACGAGFVKRASELRRWSVQRGRTKECWEKSGDYIADEREGMTMDVLYTIGFTKKGRLSVRGLVEGRIRDWCSEIAPLSSELIFEYESQ